MPGAHARDDRNLRALRMVTGAVAGLGLLAAAVLPFAAPAPAEEAADAAQAVVAPRTVQSPQDVARADEWWLTTIHGAKAAKLTRGSGITVAVLDTGVDGTQPDLAGRVIQGPDFTSGGRRPGSKYWGQHGTSMASIIAGRGHGVGYAQGVLGVAPLAKILSIRVTLENDDPLRKNQALMNQSRDAVAKGIRYAVDHGADVINMSLGGGNSSYNGSPTDEAAVQYALDKGVVLVASMGNDGSGPAKKYFPAAYPGVIAVGSVDRKFKPWQGSNRGDYIAVSAPGVNIACAGTGGSYVEVSGTSPSTAIVAGVAALVKSRFPTLTPDQIKQALERGTTHPPAGGHNDKVGAGTIDAVKALNAAANPVGTLGGSATPTPAGSVAAVPTAAGSSVNVLLIGILGGGGALVILGLTLGWRQRRRLDAPEPVRTLPAYTDEPVWPPVSDPYPASPLAGPSAPVPPPQPPTEPFETVSAFDDDPLPSTLEPFQVSTFVGRNGAVNGHANGHRVHPPADEDLPLGAPVDAEKGDFRDDPLGDRGAIPPGSDAAGTPLGDESWRSVQRPEDSPEGPLTEDDLPTGHFPSVAPLSDTPPDFSDDRPAGRRRTSPADDEDDFRPPWL